MKIVYLITGSGGAFYCGNCYRDMLYFRAIRKVPGITAQAIPLYLPPDKSNIESGFEKEVFFGAVSMYLREKVRIFRNMPLFLEKLFNSLPLLKIAGRRAGTTRTEGLEELTLNMIGGDNTFRDHEVERLLKYIAKDGTPDIIHLSNALIIGLARQIRKKINAKIVCSLLNEDDWINDMAEPFGGRAWEMIARESENIDSFITPSNYYKDFFISKTGINGEKIHVVPLGFDPEHSEQQKDITRPPAIGYFCRVNNNNGFDKLVDAFIKIKSKDLIPHLTLNVCGGYTGDDRSFVSAQIKKIRKHGFLDSLKIYPEFQGNKKAEFFNEVDLISVPVRKYDGYGLYIIEANGAGVPVVQPSTGAFPEIISITGGGITYLPDTIDELSDAILRVMTDERLRADLGKTGKIKVRSELSLEKMSAGLSAVYNRIFN